MTLKDRFFKKNLDTFCHFWSLWCSLNWNDPDIKVIGKCRNNPWILTSHTHMIPFPWRRRRLTLQDKTPSFFFIIIHRKLKSLYDLINYHHPSLMRWELENFQPINTIRLCKYQSSIVINMTSPCLSCMNDKCSRVLAIFLWATIWKLTKCINERKEVKLFHSLKRKFFSKS